MQEVWILLKKKGGKRMKEEICIFCGYNISKAKERYIRRGRQWAGSMEFNNKWICGNCADELREALR